MHSNTQAHAPAHPPPTTTTRLPAGLGALLALTADAAGLAAATEPAAPGGTPLEALPPAAALVAAAGCALFRRQQATRCRRRLAAGPRPQASWVALPARQLPRFPSIGLSLLPKVVGCHSAVRCSEEGFC